jgi:hypothetical protein
MNLEIKNENSKRVYSSQWSQKASNTHNNKQTNSNKHGSLSLPMQIGCLDPEEEN